MHIASIRLEARRRPFRFISVWVVRVLLGSILPFSFFRALLSTNSLVSGPGHACSRIGVGQLFSAVAMGRVMRKM